MSLRDKLKKDLPQISIKRLERLLNIGIKEAKRELLTKMDTELANSSMVNRVVDNLIKESKGDKGEKGDSIKGKDGYTPIKGKDYFDGKNADEEKIIITVLSKIPKPKNGKDGKPANEEKIIRKIFEQIKLPKDINLEDLIKKVLIRIPKQEEILGKDIVEKINDLPIQSDKQIDAKHIKNLPSLKQKKRFLKGSGGDSGGGEWVKDGTTLYTPAVIDKVGIGTLTPSTQLDIVGDFKVSTTSTFLGRVNVGDNNTYIEKDVSNNMVFTDAVVGTRSLKQLGCPTYKFIKATAQAEGDLHLSSATWAVSKALIKTIKIITSSTNWDLYILQNDNGYTANDANIPRMQLMGTGSGNAEISCDLPFQDEDASNEVHLYYLDNSGANTANIYIMGFELL